MRRSVDAGVWDGGEETLFEAVAEVAGESSQVAASSADLPRATMPGTFSVPGRRWRSWEPPKKMGVRGVLRRTKRMPVPWGAYILWPERLSRSTSA